MCGRYKMSTKAATIAQVFDVDVNSYEPPERFNVAPTDPVPVVRVDDGRRVLVPLRWGLLPFWAKDPKEGARMINARVETLEDKRAFKDALDKRRCLVVSDGFYEWAGEGKNRQPHLICFEDGHVYAYAGLWARWKGPAGVLETCTVITTSPNEVVAPLHDRMPLIFDPERDAALIDAWLDPAGEIDVQALSVPRTLPGLVKFPVDKRVGNVKNDDPTLAQPLLPMPTLL